MNSQFNLDIKNERVQFSEIEQFSVELYIKREDLIHPFISGNKYRKLKYNITEAKLLNKNTLLTFGGAFSNHIAATAAVGKEFGFKTIGVIRGEELVSKIDDNDTLRFAKENGMLLKFISRGDFRQKDSTNFIESLKVEFDDFYLIPEGGTNELAVRGCEEILTEDDKNQFDFVCCSIGTGGTISGLINSSKQNQQIFGFPALKGDFLKQDIRKFVTKNNWQIITDYHFGGYAKVSNQLISFINQFKQETTIPLDPIYTGKMMFGLVDLTKNDFFPDKSKILIIHTGGLQGIKGMNQRLKQKKLQLIH